MDANIYLKDSAGNPIGTAANPLVVYPATGTFDIVSPLTTKGDLLTYTTTNTRLAVATNEYVLKSDSTQAEGIKWGLVAHTELTGVDGSTYHLNSTGYASVNTWNVAPSNKGVTNGDTHDHIGGDGASIAEGAFAFTDVTTSDSSTTKHGLLIKATSPSAGIRNIVAIDNAETAYKNTALVDNTNPEALGTASPGTSLVAARRDHVHTLPKGGVLSWSEVTGTTQACAVNTGYILNNAALVTATLPSTAAVGDVIRIVGKGAGMWKVAQNASQYIRFAGLTTTTGTSGYLQAENAYDCIEIMCTTANNGWTVISSIGNIQVI